MALVVLGSDLGDGKVRSRWVKQSSEIVVTIACDKGDSFKDWENREVMLPLTELGNRGRGISLWDNLTRLSLCILNQH